MKTAPFSLVGLTALTLAFLIGRPATISAAPAAVAPTKIKVEFDRDVRPILSENCFACHGFDAGRRQAGLRLDTPEGAYKKLSTGGIALVPGNLKASEVAERIVASPGLRMPPVGSTKKLTAAQITTLKAWIAQGAHYATHWAFVAPKRPPLPTVQARTWVKNPIDRFVLARLEKEGLKPSPTADKATLLRRVTFDLTGLPPTPPERDAFLADKSPHAYEAVVDRLLTSPHYGERMANVWLDLARYADTHGYHTDDRRDMWLWRDWVINAFNHNLPYDQFTIQQLAGDMLPNATLDQKIASGFNRNHPITREGGAIPEEYAAAYIFDRIDTTSTVFMGLTMRCAQCHDHKYDPISQKDYYRFYAFFHNVPENGLDGENGNAVPLIKVPTPAQQADIAANEKRISELDQSLKARTTEAQPALLAWEKSSPDAAANTGVITPAIRALLATPVEKRTPEQSQTLARYYLETQDPAYKKLNTDLVEARRKQTELDSAIPTTMVMQEMDKPRDTFLLIRGQYDQKGEKVTAGVPAFLPTPGEQAPTNRLGLARWLVSPSNPLTARVAVNRFWQMAFGQGIVKTAENFGTQGDRPSHPELLDWLATEFMRTGWDMKAMQKLIVTSATYRQDSKRTPLLAARDPENVLLARGARFRLPAEMVRDQALAVSGLLVDHLGGPSVKPYQPAGLWEELAAVGRNESTYVQDHGESLYRRSMYTFWKRTCPPPALQTFDAPEREFCMVRRSVTNTPMQALIVMNDPTYVEASRKFAERILTEGGATPTARLTYAFRVATDRAPRPAELKILLSVLNDQLATFRKNAASAAKLLSVGESAHNEKLDAAELAAWTDVANVILNLDETVTKG